MCPHKAGRPMFFTTLLIIAPNCKQLKYPSARMKTNGTSARVSRPPECSLQTFQYTLPNNHMEPKKLNKNWGHICKTPFLQNSEYKLIHRDRKQITTDLKMCGQDDKEGLEEGRQKGMKTFQSEKSLPGSGKWFHGCSGMSQLTQRHTLNTCCGPPAKDTSIEAL